MKMFLAEQPATGASDKALIRVLSEGFGSILLKLSHL
jgi:hypothetical protein